MRKKVFYCVESSTQDLKIYPRKDTYFRNSFERLNYSWSNKAENLRIQKKMSPTVTSPKFLELLPITMHKIKGEVSTEA